MNPWLTISRRRTLVENKSWRILPFLDALLKDFVLLPEGQNLFLHLRIIEIFPTGRKAFIAFDLFKCQFFSLQVYYIRIFYCSKLHKRKLPLANRFTLGS